MASIAIIGSGVAGLVAAHRLHHDHRITIFEASDWIGGHTHTVKVDVAGRSVNVDTGFIVHNRRTYPVLVDLFEELGVATEPTDMTFSVSSARSGLEYAGTDLRGLLAQPRNLASSRFLGMLRDVALFGRDATRRLDRLPSSLTLRRFVEAAGYGPGFVEDYLVPLGAAVWSAPPNDLLDMPAAMVCRFLDNHGLLTLTDRPQWRTVTGGCATYVDALVRPFEDRVHLSTPVRAVTRHDDHVQIAARGGTERFDAAVIATHSDQALRLLADPTDAERDVLGAIPYHANDVVLHTDRSMLPRDPRAWAAWNHHAPLDPTQPVTVTYHMNRLQNLDLPEELCVTLNRTDEIDPSRILGRWTYHHPAYTPAALEAQARYDEVADGRIAYAGAYWRYGFHEDGAWSGARAATRLGEVLR